MLHENAMADAGTAATEDAQAVDRKGSSQAKPGIEIDRGTLMKALAHVQNVVERRNTIPILANVLLSAQDGVVKLTATDMEIAVVVELAGVTVNRPTRVTAPAATLYEIVRKLRDGAKVSLNHQGGDQPLALRAGRFNTDLSVLPPEDFPSMDSGQMPHRFELAAKELLQLIDRTRFAISTEETRYYLNGIYLHAATDDAGEKVLRAVATDGHRLALYDVPLPEGAEAMPGVIVPRKTVAELRKLLDEVKDTVITVALSDTKVRFGLGAVELTSKLIDGTFPDYARVVPRHNDKVLRVAKKELAEAVARVAAISSERSRPVKFSVSEGSLTLTATSAEQGQAQDEIEATYSSTPIEIGFQARYLNDILDQIAESIEFHLSDGMGASVIRDPDNARFLSVLMPLRV